MQFSLKKIFSNPIDKNNVIYSKFKTLLTVNVIGWVIFLVGQVLDNIIAGQFLGESALAGVQLVVPIATFINAISSFCASGFAVKFSLLKGQQNEKDANKIVGLGLVTTIIIGGLFALLLAIFKNPLLTAFGAKDEVFNYASKYYDWYIGTAIILPLYSVINRICAQDGDSVFPFLGAITQVVVHLILSITLVKPLDVTGLALGYFIANICSTLICLVHFFTKRNSIKISIGFKPKLVLEAFKFGLPQLLGNLFCTIVNLVLNAYIIRKFGDTYLAAFSVINFIVNIKLLFNCVSDSINPFVSVAKGSNNNDDINYCFYLLKKWCVIISIIATIVICALCLIIPYLFGINNQSANYMYCYLACLIISPTFIFYAFWGNIGLVNNALGRPRVTILTHLVCSLLCPILFPILFSLFMGFMGIIVGFAIGNVIGSLIIILSLLFIHKPHKVFLAPFNDEKQFTLNILLENDYIANNREILVKQLQINNIEQINKEKILNIYDESCRGIKKLNNGNKILLRVTYAISDKTIRIITRNSGRILSKQEKDKEAKENLSEHVVLSNLYDNDGIIMSTTISFNTQKIILKRL